MTRPTPVSAAAEPWLPLHVDWPTRNVAAQEADPGSMLSLYRGLLELRRAEPALSIGSIHRIHGSDHVLAYQRQHGASRLQIMLNLSGTERQIAGRCSMLANCCLSTLGSSPPDGWLRPDEGLILRLSDA